MANKFNSSALSAFVDKSFSLMVLRVAPALLLFINHGYGKIINVLHGNFQFGDPVGIGPVLSLILAAFAEGICTLFLIAGYYTRLFAFFLIINFIVAYYAAGQELALMYLIVFVVIFLLGPGKWSLDS